MLEETLAAFYKIADHLSKGDTVDEALASAVEFATVFLKCDECFTYVREGEELVPWVWKYVQNGSLERSSIPVNSGFVVAAQAQGAPIAISEDSARATFAAFAEWSRDPGETFVCAPFLSRSQLVGLLTLRHWRPRSYSHREFRFLSSIGYMVGAELGIAQLERQNADLVLELETRKLVARSKGILQRDLRISEQEADLVLQRQSQQKKRPIKEIAEALILSAEVRQSEVRQNIAQVE